ncbi:universal stress protein [Pseudonocardia hydrocarbonoxydans]|uniref:universal stress protein n=1 Tax=Pseudonocardia hydrocarbonoxydans TaxID=76726 RepID=UPI0031D5F830
MRSRDERPIVAGVDASGSARSAADWAAALAAVWGAPLHLLHAVPNAPRHVAAPDAPGWLRELAAAAERAGAGPSRVEVIPGATIDVLADRAPDARMLVLGSYGEGAWSGMLAGTVALTLAGHVPCPVAVVRGGGPKLSPPRSGPIVVGVDGSAASHAALLLAADLAVSLGTHLVAVHAWSDISETEHGLHRRSEDAAELAAQGGALLSEETRAISELYPGLAVADDLVSDSPVRTLLARADGARMLVVGHRGRPPAPGMGLGSTSRALVEFAECPVVVTPPVPVAARSS